MEIHVVRDTVTEGIFFLYLLQCNRREKPEEELCRCRWRRYCFYIWCQTRDYTHAVFRIESNLRSWRIETRRSNLYEQDHQKVLPKEVRLDWAHYRTREFQEEMANCITWPGLLWLDLVTSSSVQPWCGYAI